MNKNDVNATSLLSELLEKAEALLALDDQETSSTKVLQVLFDIVDARTTNVNDASVVRDMLGLVVDVAKDEQASTVQRAGSLSELIAEAEELLASSSEDTDTMMTLIADIKVAVMGDEKVIDRAKLEETLALAKLISADYYTEESYDVLQKAIEQAETVLADEAKVQVSIEDAYKALYDAVENLEARVVLDTRALENEIALSEGILANSDAYTPNSIAGLQTAVDQAKAVLANATQQTELDEATTALHDVRLLAKQKADITALKALIDQVKTMVVEQHQEETQTLQEMMQVM